MSKRFPRREANVFIWLISHKELMATQDMQIVKYMNAEKENKLSCTQIILSIHMHESCLGHGIHNPIISKNNANSWVVLLSPQTSLKVNWYESILPGANLSLSWIWRTRWMLVTRCLMNQLVKFFGIYGYKRFKIKLNHVAKLSEKIMLTGASE